MSAKTLHPFRKKGLKGNHSNNLLKHIASFHKTQHSNFSRAQLSQRGKKTET